MRGANRAGGEVERGQAFLFPIDASASSRSYEGEITTRVLRRDPRGQRKDRSRLRCAPESGAYSQEERTTPASAAGMSYGQVLGELKRVQEIIDLGYDPNSLIPIKKDFRD